MKIRNKFSIMTLLISGIVSAQLDRSKLPEPSIPRPVEIGDYQSFALKNGLKVFIIENHKLPRVSFSLQLDHDPIFEGSKAGYLDMIGQMMRTGTETRTKKQIDEEIDFIGASLSVGSQSVFASGLSKYQEKILELMTDVIFNPIFPEEELEKIRTQTLSALAAAKDDPNSISANLNSILVYGATHPYGELQTEETTKNITASDLKTHHKKYFVPNVAYLAVVGDVDVNKTKKLIKTYFGDWKGQEVEDINHELPQTPNKTQVNLLNRGNSVQSVISVTYPVALPPGHKDIIPVRLMKYYSGRWLFL